MDYVPASRAREWSRRGVLAGAAALPFLLTGCLDRSSDYRPPVEAGAFPVTIEHVFGSTTVPSSPRRIVTLGMGSNEICADFGVVPAGYALPPDRSFAPSWFVDRVSELKSLLPESFVDQKDIPWQTVENLRPDLILAVNSNIVQAQFESLNGIAPTLPYLRAPFEGGWRDYTSAVGRALGRPHATTEVVADTEAVIAAAVRPYKDLRGASVLCLEASAEPGSHFRVYSRDSTVMRTVRDFGCTTPGVLESVATRAKGQQYDRYFIAQDEAPALTADVYVIAAAAGEEDAVRALNLHRLLPVKHEGTVVYTQSQGDFLSLRTGSPSGVKWACQTVLPQIAKGSYYAKR